MKAQEFQQRLAALEEELTGLETRLGALQLEYEARAEELRRLRGLQRRLEAHPALKAGGRSWTSVCRLMGWPVESRGAHPTVKLYDPGLHALLHICLFDSYCALERVTYAP